MLSPGCPGREQAPRIGTARELWLQSPTPFLAVPPGNVSPRLQAPHKLQSPTPFIAVPPGNVSPVYRLPTNYDSRLSALRLFGRQPRATWRCDRLAHPAGAPVGSEGHHVLIVPPAGLHCAALQQADQPGRHSKRGGTLFEWRSP